MERGTPCAATRRDGRPCTSRVLGDARYCWAHDPALVEKRREGRRKGGENRANRVRLSRVMPLHLVPVFHTLSRLLDDVIAGRADPKTATAAAAVARAMVMVLSHGELEERLRRLEERSA